MLNMLNLCDFTLPDKTSMLAWLQLKVNGIKMAQHSAGYVLYFLKVKPATSQKFCLKICPLALLTGNTHFLTFMLVA